MDLIINVLEQGLLFGIVAMGVYITFKILNLADMSTDGTYPLGGAICAALLVKEVNPLIAVAVATIGGALAGLISALLNVKLKISSLMSGILVMTGLYSVKLMIMANLMCHYLVQAIFLIMTMVFYNICYSCSN